MGVVRINSIKFVVKCGTNGAASAFGILTESSESREARLTSNAVWISIEREYGKFSHSREGSYTKRGSKRLQLGRQLGCAE